MVGAGAGRIWRSAMSLKRIKRIRSHAGHASYIATQFASETAAGFIPQQADIPSPYAYSPEWNVFRLHDGRLVTIRETSHRCFDVFLVPAAMLVVEAA
jgi:hypothetical protein